MIAKLKAAYARLVSTKAGKLGQRVIVAGVAAFLVTFAGQSVAASLFQLPQFLDLSLWERVLGSSGSAAATAALALLQSIVTAYFTGQPQLTATARRAAVREQVSK